jgi:hypothetical protein
MSNGSLAALGQPGSGIGPFGVHPEFIRAEFRPRAGAAESRAARLLTGSLYAKSVQAHWTETTVGKHGELVLETVPFEPGQPVEVLVVSKTSGSMSAGGRSLRDSVIEFVSSK